MRLKTVVVSCHLWKEQSTLECSDAGCEVSEGCRANSYMLGVVQRVAGQLEGSRASSGAAASTSTASQATAEHTGQASPFSICKPNGNVDTFGSSAPVPQCHTSGDCRESGLLTHTLSRSRPKHARPSPGPKQSPRFASTHPMPQIGTFSAAPPRCSVRYTRRL